MKINIFDTDFFRGLCSTATETSDINYATRWVNTINLLADSLLFRYLVPEITEKIHIPRYFYPATSNFSKSAMHIIELKSLIILIYQDYISLIILHK